MADVDLSIILQHLTNNDPTIRQQAEAYYENLKKDSNVFPFSLLSVIATESCDAYIRQLATVLLRRSLICTSTNSESVFVRMAAPKQQEFLNAMIVCVRQIRDRAVRIKICDLAGELAGYVLEDNQWPDIVEFALVSAQSAEPLDREIGLSVLSSICGCFVPSSPEYYNVLKIIGLSLVDTTNECKNINQAIGALYSMLLCASLETQVDEFRVLLQNLLGGMQLLVQHGTEDAMCAYAQVMVDIAEEKPSYFSSALSETFAFVVRWLEQETEPSLPASVKYLLVELLVTVCSNAPKKCRKLKGAAGEKNHFTKVFLPICLKLMAQVGTDELWVTRDDVEAIDEKSSASDVGESALNRCCNSLGVACTYPVISSMIAPYIVSPVWQHQYAAIQCMANYLEVSVRLTDKSQLQVHRMEVYTTLSHFINSEVPQVRSAAYYAFSQLLMCHGAEMKGEQTTALMHLIAKGTPAAVNPAPRVRRSALIAIANFIDVAKRSVLEKNAEFILTLAAGAIREGPNIVRESCLTLIIGIAENLRGEKLWETNYGVVMPVLKELMVMSQAESQDAESLWAQTLECSAIVGEAAGKTLFYTDAIHLMNLLGTLQAESDGSEPEMFVMKAWVRIARCMGTEFLPYVPGIMKQLFTVMSVQVVVPDDQYDIENVDDRSDLEMIETSSGWVAVRHAAVEELATASQLLILLAEKLQENFYPYVEQSMKLLSTLINSPHDDIKSFAIVALPEMVRAAGKATAVSALQQLGESAAVASADVAMQEGVRTAVEEMGGYCTGLLVHSIQTESSLVLIMTALQSMKQCMTFGSTNWLATTFAEATGAPVGSSIPYIPFLNAAQLSAIATSMNIVLQDSLQRRAVLQAEAQMEKVVGGDYGDEDDQVDHAQFMEESGELHYNLSDVLCAMFRTQGSAFFAPFRDVWHEGISNMCRSFCLAEDQQFAGSVICDVVEYGLDGSIARQYFEAVMPLLVDVCTNTADPGPRRNAAYALGMMCEKYPTKFFTPASQALQALGALRQCIARGEEDDEPRGFATDNAVSAVGIILEQMDLQDGALAVSLGLDSQLLWGQWLAYLPLRDDTDEGVRVIKQLIRLVTRRHGSLLSQQNHMVRTVALLLEVVHNPVVLEATAVSAACAEAVCDLFGGPNQLSGDALVVLRKALSDELNATLDQIAQSYGAGGAESASPSTTAGSGSADQSGTGTGGEGSAAIMTAASTTPVAIQDVLLRR